MEDSRGWWSQEYSVERDNLTPLVFCGGDAGGDNLSNNPNKALSSHSLIISRCTWTVFGRQIA